MCFTPAQTFLGGLLLHISTSSLLSDTGRVLGVSSLVDGAFFGDRARWRWALLAGIVTGPIVAAATGLTSAMPDQGLWTYAAQPISRLALAGALVGFGSKLGSGCTSGHFLCGSSRLSPRSLVATATFMVTAIITARLFPAPLHDKLPAYAPTYPTTQQLVLLSGAVVVALIARDALAWLMPKLMGSTATTTPSSESEPLTGLTTQVASPEAAETSWVATLPYLLSGTTFSLGLAVAGMVNPLKVLGFLRIPPPLDTFDPSLAMVVVGAVVPNGIHYYVLRAKQTREGKTAARFPWEHWRVPSRTDIDWRLVAGAAVFGVGWGIAGVCPGPGIETAGGLIAAAWEGQDVSAAAVGWGAYVVNLVLGMAAARGLDRVLA